MNKKVKISKEEQEILNQVPPDYYQKGIKNNYLQKTWHTGKLNAVLGYIGREPKRVLDVGCASGWFLSEIRKKYPKAEYYGIDKYKSAVVFGNKKYKNINLVYGDAHDLPYKSKYFDLVICTEVLEHVDNPDIVLKEIKRVLSTKGQAIVEMDSGNIIFRIAWYWWTNIRNGVWMDAHVHVFNVKKLEKLIKKAKFNIINKKIFNYSMAVVYQLEKKL